MKHIYVNLKRFDVPPEMGGVNRLGTVRQWAQAIVSATGEGLSKYNPQDVEFVQFYPEAHLLGALAACPTDGAIQVGCQGVHYQDTAVGGNFGAFTCLRPAAAMATMGCSHTLIGHCEERNDKLYLLSLGGCTDPQVVDGVLNQEVKAAQARGLQVLFCVGERSEETECWQEVIRRQLTVGLADVDMSKVVIGYEPLWSIGPGKVPAGKEHITMVAQFIKEVTQGCDVVYGGGLKLDNAGMLSEIEEIDGGLIALTRFQGDIGFYPDEYLDIIQAYLGQ